MSGLCRLLVLVLSCTHTDVDTGHVTATHTHAGLCLARHPDRPIHVPLVQPPPLLSEDRLAEVAVQEEALRSLGAGTSSAQGEQIEID